MSGIYDLAKGILNRRDFDRTIGLASSAAATPAPSPRAAGLGGGGNTAKVDEAYWEGKRAADQAQREAAMKASDSEWAGMMGDAAKRTSAFNAAGAKEWNTNEALKGGGSSSSPPIGDTVKGGISPRGANGEKIATDQNGLAAPTPIGSDGSGSSGESNYANEEDEDQSTGYDMASNDSGGEPMATGGRVRAGGLYHVAEGGKDEVYVQDDGDTFPLTDDMRMRPKESGTIVPNSQVADIYGQSKPDHYLSLAERAAMAPAMAKREAAAKAVEQARRDAVAKTNPDLLSPALQKDYLAETDRTERLAAMQSDPRTAASLRAQAAQRRRATTESQSRADVVSAANDPYNKVLDAQRQRLEAQGEKEAQRQQRAQADSEAAARGITSMHGSEVGREQIMSLGGNDALKAAEGVARSNLFRTINRAGGMAPDLMNESDENLRKIRAGMAAGS